MGYILSYIYTGINEHDITQQLPRRHSANRDRRVFTCFPRLTLCRQLPLVISLTLTHIHTKISPHLFNTLHRHNPHSYPHHAKLQKLPLHAYRWSPFISLHAHSVFSQGRVSYERAVDRSGSTRPISSSVCMYRVVGVYVCVLHVFSTIYYTTLHEPTLFIVYDD